MTELIPNNPNVCNADALSERREWPAGFYFTQKPFIGRGLKISSGTSWPLPTNKYKPGEIGEDATVICYCGPADKPAIDVYRRGFRLVGGVHLQRGEFYRKTINGAQNVGVWKTPQGNYSQTPNRDGSVALRFGRIDEAPGGKSLIDQISCAGFDRSIHVKDEANHITIQQGIFSDNWTVYRSDHDQSFGIKFGELHLSGSCDTVMDCDRGGRWHIEYLYSNSPALIARFRNLGPNRSSGTISQLHLDSNANGWGLLDAPDSGWLKLKVGGHIAKNAVPREGWLNYTPSGQKDIDYHDLWFPAQTRP